MLRDCLGILFAGSCVFAYCFIPILYVKIKERLTDENQNDPTSL